MISLTGTIKAIIVGHYTSLLHLLIQDEHGQEYMIFFDQFVLLMKESLKRGDAIMVNCEVMGNYDLHGKTIEFLNYQLKDQDQVVTLPEKMAASYRKMMFMQQVSMQLGQQFKAQGDNKNARYYLTRSISLRLEMPSLAQISQLCQVATC